jgi:Flp pilus assembly protein TadD
MSAKAPGLAATRKLTDSPQAGGVITLTDAYRLAVGHEQAGRLDEAEHLLREILKQAPEQPDTLHLLGVTKARREQFAEAAALIEQAIAITPDAPIYHRNICEIYRRLSRYEEAVTAGQRAVALTPDDPHALVNLAIVYYDCLRFNDGVACCERAIALQPDLPGAHFELAEALLVQGKFERGWKEYEWRFRIAGAGQLMPANERPHWDGKPIANGTLLLIADQGFGDVIQFARFVPWARGVCPDMVLACSRQLQSVVAQICPDLPMFDRWDQAPDYVAYSSLSGLPQLYGVTLNNIPAEVPYLHADPARRQAWGERLAALTPPGYRRVGIAWAGRPTHNNDFNRSASLDDFSPLSALPGVVLLSLQKGDRQSQIGGYLGRAPLLNLGPELTDYEDTMAVTAHLDLLVTVDTSVAHVAGAMGRPAWVVLPYAPDWRWLLDRDDTPWYPSLRLFRQPAPRNWDDVFAKVAKEFKAQVW